MRSSRPHSLILSSLMTALLGSRRMPHLVREERLPSYLERHAYVPGRYRSKGPHAPRIKHRRKRPPRSWRRARAAKLRARR